MQDKMGETIPILPLLLPIGAILLIWVIRHKDWLQARLLGENGLKDKLSPKSWPWHLAKSLSREWHQDKAVLITGCDSGLGYRCAALTSAKLISINFHFMQYKKSTFQDIKSFSYSASNFLLQATQFTPVILWHSWTNSQRFKLNPLLHAAWRFTATRWGWWWSPSATPPRPTLERTPSSSSTSIAGCLSSAIGISPHRGPRRLHKKRFPSSFLSFSQLLHFFNSSCMV